MRHVAKVLAEAVRELEERRTSVVHLLADAEVLNGRLLPPRRVGKISEVGKEDEGKDKVQSVLARGVGAGVRRELGVKRHHREVTIPGGIVTELVPVFAEAAEREEISQLDPKAGE